MQDSDFKNEKSTRALQESVRVRKANLESMQNWGVYCMLKVSPLGDERTTVEGYVTHMTALSGKTPLQMEILLGLKLHQLAHGADIYRLTQLPAIDEFEPRGYTTLVDGLELKDGLKQDRYGYRPGHGAFQITLTKPIKAVLIKRLMPNEAFEPGIHPSLLKLYPAR